MFLSSARRDLEERVGYRLGLGDHQIVPSVDLPEPAVQNIGNSIKTEGLATIQAIEVDASLRNTSIIRFMRVEKPLNWFNIISICLLDGI